MIDKTDIDKTTVGIIATSNKVRIEQNPLYGFVFFIVPHTLFFGHIDTPHAERQGILSSATVACTCKVLHSLPERIGLGVSRPTMYRSRQET